MNTPPAQLLRKAFLLLRLIVADKGETALPEIAEQAGVPTSTAHRLVATLVDEGMLVRSARGRYMVGPVVRALTDAQSLHSLLRLMGQPIVDKLARETGHTAHLGVFEADMVTYLLKSGEHCGDLFTREGMALEAYCSGIGKILLAHLSDEDRERYLSGGPFVPLTPNTITDPELLREELDLARRRGYAIDNCEIGVDLRCIATPVLDGQGRAIAALSLSIDTADFGLDQLVLFAPTLRAKSVALQASIFPVTWGPGPRVDRHAH